MCVRLLRNSRVVIPLDNLAAVRNMVFARQALTSLHVPNTKSGADTAHVECQGMLAQHSLHVLGAYAGNQVGNELCFNFLQPSADMLCASKP